MGFSPQVEMVSEADVSRQVKHEIGNWMAENDFKNMFWWFKHSKKLVQKLYIRRSFLLERATILFITVTRRLFFFYINYMSLILFLNRKYNNKYRCEEQCSWILDTALKVKIFFLLRMWFACCGLFKKLLFWKSSLKMELTSSSYYFLCDYLGSTQLHV